MCAGTLLCALLPPPDLVATVNTRSPLVFPFLLSYFFLTGNWEQHFSTVIFTYSLFTGQVKSFLSLDFFVFWLFFFLRFYLFIWESERARASTSGGGGRGRERSRLPPNQETRDRARSQCREIRTQKPKPGVKCLTEWAPWAPLFWEFLLGKEISHFCF